MVAPTPGPYANPRRPLWWRRIHWRLMASYVLLATFVIGTIWIFLNTFLSQTFHRVGAEDMVHKGRVATALIQRAPASDPAHLDPLADELATMLDLQVVITDLRGQRLGDSQHPLRDLPQLEPLSLETDLVRDAERFGEAFVIRHPDALAVLPITEPRTDTTIGWLHLRASLHQFHPSTDTFWATLSFAALLAVIIAGILGFIASRFFSQPLSELGQVAISIARGDYTQRIRYPVADELGLLADSLDFLSDQLSEKIGLLTEEKSRLTTILSSMGEGVFVVNRHGRVALMNPAVRDMLGLAQDGGEGCPIDEIAPTPELTRAFERAATRAEPTLEEFVVTRGQERLDIMVSIAPITERGEVRGMVAVLNDLTPVRRLERIRRDFVANVSHELRTPLTVLQGYAETLLSADFGIPDTALEFIETMLRHTVRLSQLVNDLLQLASIEGRGLDARLGPVDARVVAEETLELLQPVAEDADIRLTLTTDDDLPMAHAESRALGHVLRNLLENGLKYTPEGGTVDVQLHADPDHVRIVVRDNGVGIAPEHLPRIFERFYRVDEGRSRDVGGSGLGLALVKHLVSTLGATIEVDSEVGVGTTFTLMLRRD